MVVNVTTFVVNINHRYILHSLNVFIIAMEFLFFTASTMPGSVQSWTPYHRLLTQMSQRINFTRGILNSLYITWPYHVLNWFRPSPSITSHVEKWWSSFFVLNLHDCRVRGTVLFIHYLLSQTKHAAISRLTSNTQLLTPWYLGLEPLSSSDLESQSNLCQYRCEYFSPLSYAWHIFWCL